MSERERYTKKLCLSSLSVVVYWCSVDDVNDVLFFFLSLSLSLDVLLLVLVSWCSWWWSTCELLDVVCTRAL